MDNYCTHKHRKVKEWLAVRPRFHVHYTPTYASWINQVERWFGLITQQAIRRGSFPNVKELISKINSFVEHYNTKTRPFAWVATAESILAKIARLSKRISGTEHMYVDKPMRGANLAQAIARVNRVSQDKPGGLVVDYIGIAPQLKAALATYTAARGKGKPTLDVSEAVRVLKEQIQVAKGILHPVDWSGFRERGKALELIPHCLDHVLGIPDGKQRFCDQCLSWETSPVLEDGF